MKIGGKDFDTEKHMYVMGILNVTPDSFSDGGRHNEIDRALAHAGELIRQGAAIIDVGGESTRPGFRPVPDQEEIERVVPVIERLRTEYDTVISVDTCKSRVAEAALKAGAHMVNDIWGLKYDKRMAEVIAGYQVPCCLMHNRARAEYGDFMTDVKKDLEDCLTLAGKAGIGRDRIILDPGVGFGKSYENNLEIIARLEELADFGCPLLLGTSRKSVIGLTLDLHVDQREEGTAATTVIGRMKGCSFVRVHDVRTNIRAIRMTEAVLSYSRSRA